MQLQEHNTAFNGQAGLDYETLLKQFDSDRDILMLLSEVFLEECPKQLADVEHAVSTRDAAALAGSAHKLKGSVGIFGQTAALEAAGRLELMGKTETLVDLDLTYGSLEKALSFLTATLSSLPQSPAT